MSDETEKVYRNLEEVVSIWFYLVNLNYYKLYFYVIYNSGNYLPEYNHSKKRGNLMEHLSSFEKWEKVTKLLTWYNLPYLSNLKAKY